MLRTFSVTCCGAAFVVAMIASPAIAKSAAHTSPHAAHQAVDVTTDAGITSAVKSRLVTDKTVSGLKIDVDTKDGVVTLRGRVSSAAERAEAVRLARTTTGVKSVRDQIVLDTAATSGRTSSDDTLTIEIKDDTKETAEKITNATKKAAGAVKDTKIEIKDDTTPQLEKAGEKTADAAITSAVKTKLLGDPKVAGLKIDVDTRDNVVTLTGTVSSEAEKAEAIRLAKTTTGVKSVVDKLVVR